MLNVNDLVALESLIDAHGLTTVLEAVGSICIEKGHHIQESYSDTQLAKRWNDAGYHIDSLSSRNCITGVDC